MERKDVCKHSLKGSEQVKTWPTNTSIKFSSKGEATFVSDVLFHRLLFLAIGCNISLNNGNGDELWVYLPVLLESIL